MHMYHVLYCNIVKYTMNIQAIHFICTSVHSNGV